MLNRRWWAAIETKPKDIEDEEMIARHVTMEPYLQIGPHYARAVLYPDTQMK